MNLRSGSKGIKVKKRKVRSPQMKMMRKSISPSTYTKDITQNIMGFVFSSVLLLLCLVLLLAELALITQ